MHPFTKNKIYGTWMNNAKKYIFAQKKILNHPTIIMQPFIQKFFINFLFVQILSKQLGLNKGI